MPFFDENSNKKIKQIMDKAKVKELVRDYCMILLGTAIMAVGYVVFVSPLKLAPGGVYGIAIILHHLFNFPIGLSGLCLDLPLLLIGTLWLGPKFGAKTVASVLALPAFISVLEYFYGYEPLVSDPSATVILVLFGSVLIGFGLGIIFKTRATSGGTDIIAMIIAKYVKHVSLGKLVIIVDSTVVLLSLVAFKDWTIPLYSWLVIYIEGIIIDKVVSGGQSGKAVMIISEKPEEIKDCILQKLQRGGTFIKGEGMYNHSDKKIIYTTVSRKQLPQLIHYVHETDPAAFLSVLEASEVLGNGFASLKEKAEA